MWPITSIFKAIGLALIPIILIGGVVGWVWNIVKIFGAPVLSGMEVARAIGVFVAPLGAVLGYF